jgi:polyhydroxyalkanoate synthesis regulator phasin
VRDDLRRVALFASGVAEITRHRAEELVRTWSRGGDAPREQVQEMVRELMEWSRQNRKELARIVRAEIETQIASLGVARSSDLERLEQRLDKLESQRVREPRTSTTGARKSTRTTGARKSTRTTGARKSTRTTGARKSTRTKTSGKSTGQGSRKRASGARSKRGGSSR